MTKRMTGLPTAGPPDLGEPSDSNPKVAVRRQPTAKWPADLLQPGQFLIDQAKRNRPGYGGPGRRVGGFY